MGSWLLSEGHTDTSDPEVKAKSWVFSDSLEVKKKKKAEAEWPVCFFIRAECIAPG